MIDETTFVDQVKAYERMLYRVAYGILRDDQDCLDAVQNALTKAWAARSRTREETFKTWLTRIVINECYDTKRRQRREIVMPEISEDGSHQQVPDLHLHEMISGLNEKLRITLLLHYLEGYRVHEIASMLRIPSGTVKWRLSRARRELKEVLVREEAIQGDRI